MKLPLLKHVKNRRNLDEKKLLFLLHVRKSGGRRNVLKFNFGGFHGLNPFRPSRNNVRAGH